MQDFDAIVIGSGIGGLVAGAMLARYGKQVLVCESHTVAGGAAHSFSRRGFHFDSGPSFYCGLVDRQSLNPLRQVFDMLEESIATIPYDPLGHYHFPEGSLPVYANAKKYLDAVAEFTLQGAKELLQFQQKLLVLYEALRGIPALALRADWQLIPVLVSRYWPSMLKLLSLVGVIGGSAGQLRDFVREYSGEFRCHCTIFLNAPCLNPSPNAESLPPERWERLFCLTALFQGNSL